MKQRPALFAGSVAMLLIACAATWADSSWQKDPDTQVDPAKVVTSALLPGPDPTIGDTDTTVAGIAGVSTGIDSSVSDPTDPPSSGGTLWVDNTPLDGDCPQATFTTIQAAVNASAPNDT